MHKFIIVGHPQSGYQEVENLLYECGMGKAKPSRREGLLPDQISDMLRQAHGTPALAAINAAEQIEQIGTAPVWHGMAMDLMLGNLDQRFWGWSDPGAIHLLEYWKQLDPTINFVFVYADPQSSLVGPGTDDALSVEAKLSNWHAFNAAMLHFYNRNPKRSVLVQAEQVRQSVRAYLQQLRTELNAPLEDPPAHLLLELEGGDLQDGLPERATLVAGELLAQKSSADLALAGDDLEGRPDESALSSFVAGHCVALHPQVVQLYDGLQAVANLPFERGMLAVPADAAWLAFLISTKRAERQRQALLGQEGQLASLQQQAEDQQEALKRLADDVERKQQALMTSDSRIVALNAELERLRLELAGHADTAEENELLLMQLHQVQEELEQQFIARTEREAALAESSKALEASKSREVTHKAKLDQVEKASKAQMAELERLRLELARHASTSEENELLVIQLHQGQEELKRQFMTAKVREAALAESTKALDVAREGEQKLKSEFAKEKARLLASLHKAQEVLEKQYLGINRRSAERPKAESAPRLIGAADRVKQQLTYRLGARMVANSRSVGGWISMPFALIGETRRFRADKRARSQAELPPITRYHDRHDAERVKQHLSYRLGAALLRNVRSPIGWIRLPFALRREVKAYRLEREKRRRND